MLCKYSEKSWCKTNFLFTLHFKQVIFHPKLCQILESPDLSFPHFKKGGGEGGYTLRFL